MVIWKKEEQKKNIKVLWFQLTLKINIYVILKKKKKLDKQIDDVGRKETFCIHNKKH